MTSGIRIQSAAGNITTAIDLSDAEIVNALSLGANDVTATNWSITGATGNITTSGDISVNGGNINTTAAALTIDDDVIAAGDVEIQGGDLTSNQTTFNLLNWTVTTLNIGGIADTNLGGGYGSTGVTISTAWQYYR